VPDVAYAFTIYFVTLGPLKTIPGFFLATQGASRRTVVTLAIKCALLATAIVLFVALVATGTMRTWRVSADAMAIAGGLLLVMASLQTLMNFRLGVGAAPDPSATAVRDSVNTPWMAAPVLSPLTIPGIVTPIGVAAILFFSALAPGNPSMEQSLIAVLLTVMVLDFLAMLGAAPIMRLVSLPVLQVVGWVFAALQAGLGVEAIIGAVRHLALQ